MYAADCKSSVSGYYLYSNYKAAPCPLNCWFCSDFDHCYLCFSGYSWSNWTCKLNYNTMAVGYTNNEYFTSNTSQIFYL
jgi:hypothetical protein